MKEQDKYLILIHKQLTEQLSSDEAQALDTWLEADAEHRALFEVTTKSWKESEQYKADYQPNTAKEWHKFDDKITTGKVVAMSSRRRWWVAVAAILLLAGGAFWWVNNPTFTKDNWVEIKTNNTTKDVQLPDGSKVFLNKNTSVAYRENFNENDERRVKMIGEAFFQVVRVAKPFIVQTDRADVRVLGTRFNVKSDIEATRVTVTSGKVVVNSKVNPQRVVLKKGEKAIATKAGTLQKSNPRTFNNDIAWKTRRLDFSATPLNEVFRQLETYYNVDISSTELTKCFHTGDVIKDDKIEDIFKNLEQIHSIKINKTSKGYQVTGGNC